MNQIDVQQLRLNRLEIIFFVQIAWQNQSSLKEDSFTYNTPFTSANSIQSRHNHYFVTNVVGPGVAEKEGGGVGGAEISLLSVG